MRQNERRLAPDDIFVGPGRSTVALGRTGLAQSPTRAPLGDAQLTLGVLHELASASRAQKFPDAASFRIALSSIASARSFFSRAFSCSSALSRRTSLRSSPP